MRLIANKPCSFGGRQFYIGEEIPEKLVADARRQEKMGVIAIVNGNVGALNGLAGVLFTQEQVEKMIAQAVAEAEKKKEDQLAEMRVYAAELREMEPGAYGGMIPISVKGESDEQQTTVFTTPEEIQQVFSIMQMTATDGAEIIAGVKSENILILLHAADSRKTVKSAAKEQVDKLFPTEKASNKSNKSNETVSANTKGADT